MSSGLPSYFKQELPDASSLSLMRVLVESKINTVCQAAKCPNISYCFKNKKVTFMILGDTCTRNCCFCAVAKSKDKLGPVDASEPQRIRDLAEKLGLNYIVITSVTRDDLPDGGAGIFAKTIELIHGIDQDIKVEALIPDFEGRVKSLKCVLDACPDVVSHNIETVRRLYPAVRPKADYQLSLDILAKIKELAPGAVTKSSIMLGLGETEAEVIEAMGDLRLNQCDILILGQYLAPSPDHYQIQQFIDIAQFQKHQGIGISLGFKAVLSGPLVRTSYKAEEVHNELEHV